MYVRMIVMCSNTDTSLLRFVDRDMMMRFCGCGVGHKGVREATNQFLNDRDRLDITVDNAEDVNESDDNSEMGTDAEESQAHLGMLKSVPGSDSESDSEKEWDSSDLDEKSQLDSEEESDGDRNEDQDILGADNGEEREDDFDLLGYANM
jgi:hypothetical protein